MVDESSRHLACVSAALRAAQCTMDDPTMARSWLPEKHKKMGGENYLYFLDLQNIQLLMEIYLLPITFSRIYHN